MLLRNSLESDITAVQAIYAYWVRNGTGSFEIDAPDVTEIARRRADVLSKKLPHLVAEHGGQVVGYAYANSFRPRPAYRFTVENSVYVHPEAHRIGVARLLMTELLTRCEQWGARQMIAVIGDSSNEKSIGFHREMGFEHMGTLHATGWKLDRWLDTVMMQRPLGKGSRETPSGGVPKP